MNFCKKMKAQNILETERTYLRHLTTDDAENFYNLNLNHEVLKFTGDEPFKNIEDAENFLSNYDQHKKYGVGRLAVIEKITDKFIGWCGLKYSPEDDEYDIGFRFFQDYWNKGFATETALKCVQYRFSDLNIENIVGRAMKENTASIKVLEKIGMKFKKTFDFDGKEGVIYELIRNS